MTLKKPVPLYFLLFWGWVYILFHWEKGWSLVPVPVYTYWNIFVFHTWAFWITLILITYSVYSSPKHRILKLILLGLYLFDLYVDFRVIPEMVGLTPTSHAFQMDHLPRREFLWRFGSDGVRTLIEFLLIGISFWRETPFYFDFPDFNPLQNVITKFLGVFWIFTAMMDMYLAVLYMLETGNL